MLKFTKIVKFTVSVVGSGSSYMSVMRFSTKIKPQESVTDFSIKKRPTRTKKIMPDPVAKKAFSQYMVKALATAGNYNLEELFDGLRQHENFTPEFNQKVPNVCHAKFAQSSSDTAKREMFLFREGSAVFWNFSDPDIDNLLDFLKPYQTQPYNSTLIDDESEILNYKYLNEGNKKTYLQQYDGNILISTNGNETMEKYAFSNAMALSVKLGIWESSLDHFIDSMEPITEDLKQGSKITMTREEVLRKQGELFSLRHVVNLSSDLIDTPNFYWEEEQLEHLYVQTCQYLSIPRRTYVINQRINHCLELVELLSSHLNDNHHVRLEWMIIILIMVEVGFEMLHYVKPKVKPLLKND